MNDNSELKLHLKSFALTQLSYISSKYYRYKMSLSVSVTGWLVLKSISPECDPVGWFMAPGCLNRTDIGP